MNTVISNLPVIDAELCTGCEECVRVCPDRILEIDPSGTAVVHGEQCMQCGHCYAVCPAEAIRTPFLDHAVSPAFVDRGIPEKSAPINPDMLMNLLSMRRSCRCFRDEPVDNNVLEDLVRAGVAAPSGTNCQAWQFLVLAERKDVVEIGVATADYYRELNAKAARPWLRFLLRMVGVGALQHYYNTYYETVQKGLDEWYTNGVDRLFHGAPAAIIVTADAGSSCPREDALVASQNILLMAETMGIGTCMIGFVVEAARRDRSIGTLLGLDSRQRIYSVIAVGHPDVSYQRPAGRKPLVPQFIRFDEPDS